MAKLMSSRTETRLAWLGLGAVIAGLLFLPVISARGIGSRRLIVHFHGVPAEETTMRTAAIQRKHADVLLTNPPQPEVEWQTIAADIAQVELRLTHATRTTSSFVFDYGTERIPYQDALAVEYLTGNDTPRFRVVPLNDLPAVGTIEVTVPREPPSDAEAWRPATPSND